MSLIICSSDQQRYNNEEIGSAKPYSFQNYLGNAMIIPTNSEVAVQSVKINRRGKYEIESGENSSGYIQFGAEYDASRADGAPPEDYLSYNVQSLLPFTIEAGVYDIQGYKEAVKRALDQGCAFHPDLQCKSVALNYEDDVFEGFVITIQQYKFDTDIATTLDDIRAVVSPYGVLTCDWNMEKDVAEYPNSANRQLTFVEADGVMEGWDDTKKEWSGRDLAGKGLNIAIFPQAVISQQKGVVGYGVKTAIAGDVEWIVGLVRDQACGINQSGDVYSGTGLPVYDRYRCWEGQKDNQGLPKGFIREFDGEAVAELKGWNEAFFYDYQVRSVLDAGKYYLRVYCSGHTDNTNSNEWRMTEQMGWCGGLGKAKENEVEYWLDSGSAMTGAGPYDLTTDSLKVEEILFRAHGNNIHIKFIKNGSGTEQDLVRTRTNSQYSLSPMPTTKNRLHPKIAISNTTGCVISFVATKCYGRNINTTFLESIDRGYAESYYALAMNDGDLMGETAHSCDARVGHCRNFLYTPKYMATNYIDFKVGMVLYQEDDEIPPPDRFIAPTMLTEGADAMDSLGFEKHWLLLVDGSASADGDGVIWTSAIAPEGVASSSLFITCPTLTQISQNFGHGTPSKIIYHMPQFDNSGKGVGPLFFEASEKTYLSLGNTEPLSINQLEINIVDSEEKIVDELQGNTIVVLHLRKER